MKIYFFKTWSPDMAWLFGYIWADGCVREGPIYKLNFECCEDDRELIDRVYLLLNCHQKIQFKEATYIKGRKGQVHKCRPKVRLDIGSRCLVESLIELGVRQNKSALDLPFPHVPVEFLNHFVRGYLDGDGWVSVGKYLSGKVRVSVGFCGGQKFLEGLRFNMVSGLGVRRNAVSRNGKIFRIQWSLKWNVRCIYQWLYSEAFLPCLMRKRLKMQMVYSAFKRTEKSMKKT